MDFIKTDYLLAQMTHNSADDVLCVVESFYPCRRAAIQRQHEVVKSHNYKKCAHRIIENCKALHYGTAYMTCIQFKQDVECVQRHVCDILPVHIGSALDRDIYKLLYGEDELNKPEVQQVMRDLYGTIFMGSPMYFSNILTNRKELIHASRDDDKVFTIYLYDVYDRGHSIWLSDSIEGRCVFRNSDGTQCIIADTDEFRQFIAKLQYCVAPKHLDFLRTNEW